MSQVQSWKDKLVALKQWIGKDFVSGVIITMFGVLAAFWIDGWAQQTNLDQDTKQRLQNAYDESEENIVALENVYKIYSQDNSMLITFNYPDVTLAKVALQDENLQSLESIAAISALRRYIVDVESVIRILDYFQTPAFKADRTDLDKIVGIALASCRLIREVFKYYGNIAKEDSKDIRANSERLTFLYEQILKREPYTSPPDN